MYRQVGWIHGIGVLAIGCALSSVTGCGREAEALPKDRQSVEMPELGEARAALESTITLDVTDDTSIRASAPNKNFGSSTSLDVNRALVKLTPAQLAAAVAPSDVILSARLELTLVPSDTRRLPRQLGAYRMLKPWTELGATWLCAVDTNLANARPDCAGGAAWQMQGSGAFVSTPTNTAVMPASRTGVVSLDVTADVRAFASGAADNQGWLLKTPVGAVLEIAELASAESATPPRLVVQVRRCSLAECDDQNPCTADACDSSAQCIHVPVEGLACDDGNLCTQGDHCAAGGCAAGTPLPAGQTCGQGQVCDGSAAQSVPAQVS